MRTVNARSKSFPNSLADSKHVAIRMTNVHLADIPWHVGWRPCDIETLFNAMPVNSIDIVDPDGHPYAFVCAFVAGGSERHCVIASSSPALSTFAEKDLAFSGADAAKARRIAPVPSLRPSEFFKPRDTFREVRNV